MPGRKRTLGAKRKQPRARTGRIRRRPPAQKARRTPSGWVLIVGAAIALIGGAVASVIMVGDSGRLDTAPLLTFGVFAAISFVLALVGVRMLRVRRGRRR